MIKSWPVLRGMLTNESQRVAELAHAVDCERKRAMRFIRELRAELADARHETECLRVSIAQAMEAAQRGRHEAALAILAEACK